MTTQLGNNYPNPLDNFNSYSYHFIMTVASSTEAHRAMLGNKNGQSPLLSAIQNTKLGESFSIDKNSAYLLIDTRRFSQYSITELEMDHIYGTGNRVNPSVMCNIASMTVIDSTGLTFFNYLIDIMRNKIQSTRASAFFLLSVIFTGHKDDGTTETISTCYIPFQLLSMEFEFTSSGSVYTIKFVEFEGAPQRSIPMQHIESLGNVNSISTKGRDDSLGGMIQSLEDQLNAQSLKWYTKYTNDAIKNSNTTTGKLVQYMITIPDEWKNFLITTANKSKNVEKTHKATSLEAQHKEAGKGWTGEKNITQPVQAYSQLTFSRSTTITDAIKTILESSVQFLKLMSEEKRKNNTAQVWKVSTLITSDDTSYVIHFDIYPHTLPNTTQSLNTLTAGAPSKQSVNNTKNIKNLITYDYIFTGRNSHIHDLKIHYRPESAIALDTNIRLGGSGFADVAQAGQKTSNILATAQGENKSNDLSPQIRPGDPIFVSMKSVDEQKNNTNQRTEDKTPEEAKLVFKAKQEYTQTMAAFHFVSSLQLDLTVRGNPNIIRKYADRHERGGIPPHTSIISRDNLISAIKKNSINALSADVKNGVASAKEYYLQNFVRPRINSINNSSSDSLINQIDVSRYPITVKINILAPNVDFSGDYKHGEPLFSNEFFYNGAYTVMHIKTTFSHGDFIHRMSLIPADTSGAFSTSKDTYNAPIK